MRRARVITNGFDVSRRLIEGTGKDREIGDFDEFWANFEHYIEAQHPPGQTVEDILAPVEASLAYDVDRWIEGGMPLDFIHYKLQKGGTI